MSRSKFFLIVLLIAILAIAGFASYYFYLSKKAESSGAPPPSFREFLPFGRPDTTQTNGNQNTGNINTAPTNQERKQLMKLVSSPVAGFDVQTIGSTTLVRYVEKENGHISDIDMALPAIKTRITNTTIPRVYQAIFGREGLSVMYRYLGDDNHSIQTYFANIPKATSSAEITGGSDLKGRFLVENMSDLSISHSSNKSFSLINIGRSAVGTVSDFDGSKKSQIFDSPFSEWLSSWANDKTILLQTKPSYTTEGFVYSLDAISGTFNKIYGGGKGLNALLGPDEKKLLISEASVTGEPSLRIYVPSKGTKTDTGLKTITDKCIWYTNTTVYCAVPNNIPGTTEGYPDVWYQGLVSFEDSVWKIDTETLYTNQVSPISQTGGEAIDAVNLTVSKLGDYLFFINKHDWALWALRLKQ